jgi:hypothetical protein
MAYRMLNSLYSTCLWGLGFLRPGWFETVTPWEGGRNNPNILCTLNKIKKFLKSLWLVMSKKYVIREC